MAGTSYHKNLSPNQIHIPYAFTYADENAKELADGFSTSDIGKLCRVVDPDNVLYMLVNNNPPTWKKIGSTVEAATNILLGGVRVQTSGGLYVDVVGNISIKSEFLNKLQNLSNNMLGDLSATTTPSGSSIIGYPGINTTYLNIPPDSVESALNRVVNKISQMATDIQNLKTSNLPQATDVTLGGIRVTNSTNSGLAIDNLSGQLAIHSDFLSLINSISGRVLTSQLISVTGSQLVGYPGHGTSEDVFYLPPSTIQNALNSLTEQVRTNTEAAYAGVPIASQYTLGGIKVGSGLDITNAGVLSIPPASETNFGVIKLGTGLSIDPDGVVSASGGGGTAEPTTIGPKIYKIDIPDFTQEVTTWTVTPNDGGITNLVKTGEDSFQATFTNTTPPNNWNAINRNPNPSPEVIHSDTRFMRINSTAKTVELVGVAPTSNILVFLEFYTDGTSSVTNITDDGGVFTVTGTSGSSGTYVVPDGWTVTYTAPHLRIVHNKNRIPYGWSGLYMSSGSLTEMMHDLASNYMKIVDNNTILITNMVNIAADFSLYIKFI